MKGSLVQSRPARNGRPPYWELRVYGGLDPAREPGERPKARRVTRGFSGPRKAADAALRKLVTEVEEGRHRGTERPFSYLLERVWDRASPGWSPKHRERVRSVIDGWLLPALGTMPLDKLGPEHLDDLYAKMLTQGMATATIRKVHNTASRALRQAVKWGWISANPAVRASPPPVTSPEIVPPTDDQVARLLAGCADVELLAFLAIAVATGARRGEVCALRRGDVDVEGATLRFAHSISQVGKVITVEDPKTAAGFRRVSLDPGTLVAIAGQLERNEARAARVQVELDANPYLFGGDVDCSTPWKPARVTRAFARLRDACGVPGVRLHDIRHAHVSILLALGIDAVTVAGRVGHANASITHKLYAHFMPAADRNAADLWAQRTTKAPATG